MTQSAIEGAIPHRKPMLLVDEIVRQSDSEIVCRKVFHADEFFFQGHYPGFPIVPGVVLCECGMQAGAILLAQHVAEGSGVPVATRMQDVKFKRMIRPGDAIEMVVTLKERLADAFFLTAKITCQGVLAARFDFACAMASATALPSQPDRQPQ